MECCGLVASICYTSFSTTMNVNSMPEGADGSVYKYLSLFLQFIFVQLEVEEKKEWSENCPWEVLCILVELGHYVNVFYY